jgi:hypothetical protein
MAKHDQRFATMSTQSRRVKIEQNHTWRIRLLPVQLGVDKEPFIDIAQHWWNKSPMTCPRHTSESWGGNPDAVCPICEVSDRFSNSSSEEINNLGYKIRCSLRVRSFCVVFEMEDQRGNVDTMPLEEVLKPYEFDMFKSTWERFSKFQKWALSGRRGGNESSQWGILDLETGCDLLATQGAKGITLDRCDPNPIFALDDPNYDNYITKIWANVRAPKISIPTKAQLEETAIKIEEYAERGGSSRRNREEETGRGRGRGGRGNFGGADRGEDDEDDRRREYRRTRFSEDSETDLAPRAASSRSFSRDSAERTETTPPPPARRRSEPEPDAETEANSNPPAATPPPATRRASAPTRENAEEPAVLPPPKRNAPARTSEPETAVTAEDMETDQAPAPSAPPPPRRSSRPTPPPPAVHRAPAETAEAPETAEDTEPEEERTTTPEPIRRAKATAPAPTTSGVDEEEDNVPDEKLDPAPPVRQRIAEDVPPPAVTATAPAPRRAAAATDRLKERLHSLVSNDR